MMTSDTSNVVCNNNSNDFVRNSNLHSKIFKKVTKRAINSYHGPLLDQQYTVAGTSSSNEYSADITSGDKYAPTAKKSVTR